MTSPETSRVKVSTDTRVVAATSRSGGSVVTRTRAPSSTWTYHFPPPSPLSSYAITKLWPRVHSGSIMYARERYTASGSSCAPPASASAIDRPLADDIARSLMARRRLPRMRTVPPSIRRSGLSPAASRASPSALVLRTKSTSPSLPGSTRAPSSSTTTSQVPMSPTVSS